MLTCLYILADAGKVCAVRAQMTARPASLENSLALHRLKCVDCPSSFRDISVTSLGNMLRSSATGKFTFFLLTCQRLPRVYVQIAVPLALGMS